MKRITNWNTLNLKWASRIAGGSLIYPVMGSINTLVKTPAKRHFTPKLQLEKIGGMDRAVRKFISSYCDLTLSKTLVVRTALSASIEGLNASYENIVNLKRINDVKEINRFLYNVNQQLPENGLFIGCVETKYLRKQRIMKKFPPIINQVYYLLDFILKRVFPKLPITRRFYIWLTNDRNKVLSRTEMLGRIYAAGFVHLDSKFIGNNLYFVARKVKAPLFNYEPVYGPIFRMRRHGKNGRIIHVYKMRTMHAYSEFIQQYVYEQNNLESGGKLKDDFRVSTAGRFFRRYWIDELPMILNLLRGDLKIVGVRPLSSHYLSLYTEELQSLRLKHKPGLIPPFYADMPKTLEEIIDSELRYLKAYEQSPLKTDLSYLFAALKNIFLKRARSK